MSKPSSSRLLILFEVPLLAFFFFNACRPSIAQYDDDGSGGGFPVREWPNPTEKDTRSLEELTELAKFAIDEYCRNNSVEPPLTFSKLIYAQVQMTSGSVQDLVFDCIDSSGHTARYEAKIWDQPWMHRKVVGEFKKLDEDVPIVGGPVREYPSPTEDDSIQYLAEFTELANFAIDEYLKKNNLEPRLTFYKLISADVQVVSGKMYNLVFECTDDSGMAAHYEAKIWEQPWADRKELVEFKKLDEDEPVVGRPVKEYPNPNDDNTERLQKLTELAKFAVDEYCRTNSMEPLTFSRLISAEVLVSAGVTHDLVIECIDSSGQAAQYEAKIWVQPWVNHKELVKFQKLEDEEGN